MLRIGLIGYGGMGKMHAACYGALRQYAQLSAVADVVKENRDEAAEKYGAVTYRTGEELIVSAEVDVIDICLPTYLHAGHAILGMERGRHLFIEKPLCLSMDEVRLLLEAEKKAGVCVQIGQVLRFYPDFSWVKDAALSGEFGKLVSASFVRRSSNPRWAWENWFNDVERSGGVAMDLHIHDVDFIRYLLGKPDAMHSRAARDQDGTIQQIYTVYEYGGAVVTVEACWDYPDEYGFRQSFIVKFEKATAVRENEEFTVFLKDGGILRPIARERFDQKLEGINISSLGSYYSELKYFLERITGGLPLTRAPMSEAATAVETALREIELAGGIKRS